MLTLMRAFGYDVALPDLKRYIIRMFISGKNIKSLGLVSATSHKFLNGNASTSKSPDNHHNF